MKVSNILDFRVLVSDGLQRYGLYTVQSSVNPMQPLL